MITQIQNWIASFPGFAGTEVTVDALPWRHGAVGLFPRGVTELSRRQDILGNTQRRLRFTAELSLCLSKAAGADCPENAALLQAFRVWAETEPPVLGARQVFRAQKEQLKTAGRLELARYELQLTWDYDG